ncbi:protein lysB [Burkholderia cenocepacia]|uniref:Rz-like lysis system protein LysB n=1 Tax=Burkholderia cenocepacia TaxID=95486 RepID=UPI0009815713|nr:Rz-like lysis system protein LysB [Burkholderia cenocepacia]ONR49502.1 protein lysB [Burkholderia cenocepacia]ONR52317.1 protein lysB [Burkholderia cenocepacia]ONR61661.1 protein lysB [Burkholderia cenocepacia]ONR66733.1 protein lysB [Burkholderia cenocepacia]ONR75903.1 protein lysB [Burkholderia cenocepacia]
MNGLAAKIIAWIVSLATCAVVALYVHGLRAERATAQRQRVEAQQALAARDGIIARLRQDAAERAQQQARLDHAQTAIASKLDAIRFENRRLTDENAALRAWADTRLPDDVVRLQASPALTGAGDYVEHVPDGETVHAAEARAADQR